MTAQGIKNTALAVLASAGSWIANELGGWDAAMKVLIAMMAVDYLSGLAVAGIWKRSGKSENGALDSRAGFKGIVKKVFTLMLVWIGVLLDSALGTEYVRTAIIIFFVGNEGLSLLENFGLMGVPYPAFLRKALEALREKGDGGDENIKSSTPQALRASSPCEGEPYGGPETGNGREVDTESSTPQALRASSPCEGEPYGGPETGEDEDG